MSIFQWSDGHFIAVNFSYDKSLKIYNAYLTNIQNIFDKNLLGYHWLMADLYMEAL